MMTAEELIRELDAQSRAAIRAAGGVESDVIMRLLREVGLRGFSLGSNVACSMLEGALHVQLAAMPGKRERQ